MKHSAPVVVALLAACLAAGVVGETTAVTPVEKVMSLLTKLEAQLVQEGKDEAAAYDKYACFCKEQVDDKLYAIDRSKAKIKKLDAKIGELGGEISGLDGDITDLNKQIGKLETDMKEAKTKRDGEHGKFLTSLADTTGAIKACKAAVEALKDAKDAMKGRTDLELAQIKDVTTRALAVASHTAFSEHELGQLNSLLAASEPGQESQYSYHSNDIIGTVEGLLATFQKTKAKIEQDEFDAKSAFDSRQLSMANEKKFAEKDKAEKAAVVEEKREAKEAAEADKTEESGDKSADENFMKVLTGDCENKAKLWDKRSQSRSEELTALGDAMTSLKKGAAPNWKANKKLADLQTSAHSSKVVPKGHWVYVEDVAAAPQAAHAVSFLQLRRSGSWGSAEGGVAASQAAAVHKVHELLLTSARRLGSPILSAMALKVSVADDHFVKVRQIIKDLIERLQSDASSEKTEKKYCDDNTAKAVETRDKEQAKIEDFTGQIAAKEAQASELRDDIAELSKEVAGLKRALLEATELRSEEKVENEKTVKEAGEGKAAVEKALQVLKTYYKPSFIQRSAFVPKDSDREGNTVADAAPEIFDSEYGGNKDASKGIIGLLEVILSDFDRTKTTVAGEETAAQKKYDGFKTSTDKDTGAKEGTVTSKKGKISTIKGEVVTLKDDLKKAEGVHESAVTELGVLHKRCVAGDETHEERVASREKEIAALKEAHNLLEDWQS